MANRGKLRTKEQKELAQFLNRGQGAKITETTARQIKIDLETGLRQSVIARKYNTTYETVHAIKRNICWKWLVV
jgi:DNA-binding NarL/FixJ family response regulator